MCLPSDAPLQHLPSYLGFSYLGRGVSLHGCSSKVQPMLLTLDEGYLLTATLPDLQRGIAPLGPPVPPATAWGSSSHPLPLASGLRARGGDERSYHAHPCIKYSLISPIFFKSLVFPFYCFPLFLCIVHLRRHSYLTYYSLELYIQLGISFPFSLTFCFSLRKLEPPQTTTLPSCISFSLE